MRITSEDWLQAQNAVLGAALIDDRVVPRVMADTDESDFTSHCLTVYRAMRKLFDDGKPVDPVSVAASLGPDYNQMLVQLMEVTPTSANIDHYINLCREQAKVISIREIGNQLACAETSDQINCLLEKANGCMVSKQAWKAVTMSEALRSFMNRHGKKPDFLRWPFYGFNEKLRVKNGRFVVLGAEPSVGKTAFALQCAWLWAKDKRVGFFSFETDEETLTERLLSFLVGIPLPRIQDNNLSQEEWEKVCVATEEIVSSGLEFIPAAGMSVSDIRTKILESKYQMVLVDYLQIVHGRSSNRYEEVTHISMDLQRLSKSLGVTVVALSQLARSADDHVPKNSDLRESGQIEQDADVIIMLKLEKQSVPAGPRKLFVTKNKEGELFMSLLAFDGAHQRFSKIEQTSDTLSKLAGMNKKKVQSTPVLAQPPAPASEQMTILPDDYKVPF